MKITKTNQAIGKVSKNNPTNNKSAKGKSMKRKKKDQEKNK